MGRLLIKLLLALATLTFTMPASANVLRGLGVQGFHIKVEQLEPIARRAGLSETGLAKVVKNRLSKNLIAVGPKGPAQVYVRIVVLTSHDVNSKVLGYGAHIELSVKERAKLKRDPATEIWATVWFKGNVTVANPKAFAPQVVQALATLSDQFARDLKSSNL